MEQSGIGWVHWRRGLLCFLVWRNVLVVLELFNFWFHIFGLLMAVLVWCLWLLLMRTWHRHTRFRFRQFNHHSGMKKMMRVSDLDNSRNSYWSSILGTIDPRQAFILDSIRWILGHISLFRKKNVGLIQFNNVISESCSNTIKPRFEKLMINFYTFFFGEWTWRNRNFVIFFK